jgi:acetyl-CoA decarbonylase/synthase complex subunit gamma
MVDTIKKSSTFSFAGREFVRVSAELCGADVLGGWKARWGMGRMSYLIMPGLYAVGSPSAESEVLVTANYKMTFDRVRRFLGGRDVWIMVLDTKGINVWCAAGKGTFGTDELVDRVAAVELGEVVSHRRLIVPQLGAVGIAAHEVSERSGFRVKYGPVGAEDLPAYLDGGRKATDEMRRVRFGVWDRMVLIPMELVMNGKYVLLAAMLLFILAGVSGAGYSTSLAMKIGLPSGLVLLAGYAAGGVLGSILLPWLPGRAFSVKGVWVGALMLLVLGVFTPVLELISGSWFTVVSWVLVIPAITSFMVMNLTGISTYTSLSGVRKEMAFAVPLQLLASIIGIGLWIAGRFI